MKHLKFGIPLAGSLAVLLGLGLYSCADENPWGNSSKEKGKISLTLSTDAGIKTAKPMFRSEDSDSNKDPNHLGTYIDVPSIEDFSIKLEKSTGEVSSWSTLKDFKEYIANNQFDTGTYTLTAYYGEKGKQDFEAPYFEASTTFNVLSDQENEINLTAELQNSMVKINYTDAFKDYMKDFHAKIKTDGIGEPITYGNIETRPLFIEPKNANISLHFTTKGKEHTSEIVLGDFPPMAKTLHNITFDLSENTSSEDATLEIKFDETLEEEIIKIDLTKELLTTPAPTISCTGFENGQTLDILEFGNDVPQILMTVSSTDKIESAIMTIESENYNPSWGKEIDLCKATAEQQTAIEASGIIAQGFGFKGTETDLMARLYLTNFGKNLVKGNHKVSLVIKDTKGKTSQTSCVIFDNQEITLELIGNPTFDYAAEHGELTFDFNGTNPLENIKFNIGGQTVTATSCIEQTASRASEKKTYLFTLPINNPIKPNVKITASYKGEKNLGEFPIPVNIPEYKIDAFDAFNSYAYAKISTTDPSMLSAVTENITLKDLNIVNRDPSEGILKISGLKAETNYSVKSSITGDEPADDNGGFTTETELTIPNGDFSGINVNGISFDGVQVGGQYNVAPANYTLKSSIKRDTPADWATVNSLTAWEGSSNKNTWFIVPSTYIENQVAVLKSVGYNHNGSTPSKSGGAFNTTYYCTNAPADNQLQRAAGELFLGEYTFNGNESRSEGKAFASRPAEVKFDYKYTSVNGDKGYAKVEVVDADGHTIGEMKEMALEASSEMKTVTIQLSYAPFGKKAAKLRVSFKSSNNANPPINIPSGSALNEGQGLGNKTIEANKYHAFAAGSELRIDNVIAVYEGDSTPASAPKRKTIKR